MKVDEKKGESTSGYGESLIKYYLAENSFEAALFSGGKKCGRIVFNDLEGFLAFRKLMGDQFRIVPT